VALLPDGDLDRLSLATHKVADSIPATWQRSALGREISVSVLDTPRRRMSSPTSVKVALWNVECGTTRIAFEIPYYGDGFRDVVFSRGHDWAVVLADQFYPAPNPEWLLGFRSRIRKKLGVVHLGNGATVKWLTSHSYTRFVRWAPGGRFGILATSSASGSDTGGDTLFVVNPATGSVAPSPDPRADSRVRWVASMAPAPAQSALPRIIMRAEFAAGTQVMLEPADELLAVAPDGDFAVVRRLTADGTVIYQRFAADVPPRVLLRLNAQLADVSPPSRGLFSYSARDGSKQRAVVFLPPDFESGVRYPLVTWVYPGDIYRDTVNASLLRPDDDPQAAFLSPAILAGHGYVVLFPSMPLAPYGSAGDPYDHMLDGVDAAIDTLIARGIADSTRLGLFGHSYGGYAVNCIVSQSSRFRAAVTSAGLTDLTSFALQFYPQTQFSEWPAVELSLMETGQGRMGSPPWRDPNRYVRNSPIYHVDNIQTPLLISVGDNDFSGQAEELFTAMDRSGKRARLMVFRGEGHVLLSPANIRYFWRTALKWFDDYLQPTQPAEAAGPRNPGHE
jgi:dienelactone hydrolase